MYQAQRHGVQAFLEAPDGTLLPLLTVEALASGDLRSFYAYGPTGEPAPHRLAVVIEAPEHVDASRVRVLVRVLTDPATGVVRFAAPQPLKHTNN